MVKRLYEELTEEEELEFEFLNRELAQYLGTGTSTSQGN